MLLNHKGREEVSHRSEEALVQIVAKFFQAEDVGLDLSGGGFFIQREPALPGQSHGHRREAVVVAGMDCDQPSRRIAPGMVAKSTCATQILVAQASPCRVASRADARIDIFSSVFNVPHSHSSLLRLHKQHKRTLHANPVNRQIEFHDSGRGRYVAGVDFRHPHAVD